MSVSASTLSFAPALRRFHQRLIRLTAVRALALAGADMAALMAAFLLAAMVPVLLNAEVAGSYGELLTSNGQVRMPLVIGFGGMLMVWFYNRGHYSLRLPIWIEAWHLVTGCTFILLCDGFLQFAMKQEFSRLWLVHTWLFAVPLLLLSRRGARECLHAVGLWDLPTLVIGSSARLDEAVRLVREERALGYSVAAVHQLDAMPAAARCWTEECLACGAQMVILAADETDLLTHRAQVSRLALEHIPFVCVQNLGGLPVFSVDAHHFVGQEALLLVGQSHLLHPLGRALKTVFDYVVASLLLIAALPVFGVIGGVVALDGGPIFYSHKRVGSGGRLFRCLKFRTMVPDAEHVLANVLASDPERRIEWEENHKLQDDPRITWIGRFARAFSLDELPQLFNVLRGEMSLVGPRPIHPDEIDRFGEDIDYYYQVNPGITGLWQVSGRNTLAYSRRIELNTWYVKNWTLWLDVVILLKTIPTVLGRRGAY